MKAQKFTLLIVDDNENDRFLARHTFESLGTRYKVRLAANGEEAIAYLKGKGKFADRKQFEFPSLPTCKCTPAMDFTSSSS